MNTSTTHERGLTEKFPEDEAIEFKAVTLRNRLLGLWAGELMGLENEHLEDYVAVIVRADAPPPSDDVVLRKLAGDLSASGLKISEDQVQGKMNELEGAARQRVHDGEQ
jgi:hypothetical protein